MRLLCVHLRVVLALAVLTGCRFYELEKGLVFRSPQPNAEAIEVAAKTYGLKTIINLRGESPGALWWEEERETAERLGIRLINIAMSAKRLPHRKDLVQLLDSFRQAQRPLLFHCLAGVDRTGEAAAIYQMVMLGKTRESALEMLSPKFGHFEKFMPAKRYFIRDVWQEEDWALREYDPCLGNYKYYDLNDPVCKGLPPRALTSEDDT